MKILFLSTITNPQDYSTVSDYQLDVLVHGLSYLDVELDQLPCSHWLYFDPLRKMEEVKQIWGKGFTLYNRMLKYDGADIDTVVNRFKEKYYDIVILGIHHSTNNHPQVNEAYLAKILSIYNAKQVCVIDGWDRTDVNLELAASVKYFKRELIPEYEDKCLPISFGFPESGIQKPIQKTVDFAPLVPVNQCWNSEHIKSYIYDVEQEYYDDYNRSYFAYTTKKGGWDCLRHYEILMCNCIPFFLDIEKCPPKTLFRYPKELCLQAKRMVGVLPGIQDYNPDISYDCRSVELGDKRGCIERNKFNMDDYISLNTQFREHMLKHLTTKAIAKYLLEEIIK